MVSLYKIENTKIKSDGDYISAELRGLSTDVKPIEIGGKIVDNGSIFVEIDTGSIYFYDLEKEQWKEA